MRPHLQIFAEVHRLKIEHVLIDELCDRDLSEVAVRLVSDQAHSEDIAERYNDKVGVLANL